MIFDSQFWGGWEGKDRSKYYKIVMSPCSDGEMVSFYCKTSSRVSSSYLTSYLAGFMPTELTKHFEEGFVFEEVPVGDILAGRYDTLDPDCVNLIKNSVDRMPWRLYVHQPYSVRTPSFLTLTSASLYSLPHVTQTFFKGKACILGDAAHPMLPHQSQGACQAIEDAAALGIIFSKTYDFTQDVEAGLALYNNIRKPRATRVQSSSMRATENINERIGFTSLTPHDASLAASEGKLTSEYSFPSC